MSFEDIHKVTQTEQDARAKKADAQAEAKQIIAADRKAGAAEVERARADAQAQVKAWMAQAESEAGERARQTAQANDEACRTLRQKARERMDEAAALIVRKVVNS